MEFIRPGTQIDFMKLRRIAFITSIVFIVASIFSIFIQGLNYGIDFAGGTVVQVKFSQTTKTEDVRASLAPAGLSDARIQSLGAEGENKYLIRTPRQDSASGDIAVKFEKLFRETFGDENVEILGVEMVGSEVSEDLKEKGILSLFYAGIGILIYIWWRFEFKFSLGAIMALLHDVIITVGIFSITGREINLTVVAALLTIIGYSLNDTIVVFDRIRENLKKEGVSGFISVLNTSISQTLSRTLLMSLTTFVVVLCLFMLGGEVINNFAFAMMIGVIIGTYSSIFIASPVLLLLTPAKK